MTGNLLKKLPFLGLGVVAIATTLSADFDQRACSIFSDEVRMAADLYSPRRDL